MKKGDEPAIAAVRKGGVGHNRRPQTPPPEPVTGVAQGKVQGGTVQGVEGKK